MTSPKTKRFEGFISIYGILILGLMFSTILLIFSVNKNMSNVSKNTKKLNSLHYIAKNKMEYIFFNKRQKEELKNRVYSIYGGKGGLYSFNITYSSEDIPTIKSREKVYYKIDGDLTVMKMETKTYGENFSINSSGRISLMNEIFSAKEALVIPDVIQRNKFTKFFEKSKGEILKIFTESVIFNLNGRIFITDLSIYEKYMENPEFETQILTFSKDITDEAYIFVDGNLKFSGEKPIDLNGVIVVKGNLVVDVDTNINGIFAQIFNASTECSKKLTISGQTVQFANNDNLNTVTEYSIEKIQKYGRKLIDFIDFKVLNFKYGGI